MSYLHDYVASSKATRFDRFLDTNGDGTGTKSAIGDYSSGAEIFYIQPPAGTVYRIARMIVYIEDDAVFNSDGYAAIAAPGLSTGIQVRVQDDSGTLNDMTDGLPVKQNMQWKRFCYDIKVSEFGAPPAGNESMAVRWTFNKAGPYIRLNGNKNERLEVVLNDNLSTLVCVE
jgi:hypothetical protein